MRLSLFLPALTAGLILAGDPTLPVLSIDQGAAGVWQKIQKLQTTASLLHTTAHPDDEQSGLLTMASRGWGARTALVTLNRGEAGDNAIGAELFDALGLIRTDELARAAQYYGLDEQYFTGVADYGYSKRLDEAFAEWDRDALLRDLVRVIRRTRPLVVVSRWQGSARDGHGQHQAAGAITPPAVEAAGDPTRFPELEKEGLRAWRVPKLYLGGARENEGWHVRVDAGEYDPVLGDSYQNLGRLGLSLQRSQTSGRFSPAQGSAPLYFTRVGAEANAPREAGLFDGLDTSLAGAFELLGRPAPAGAIELLAAVSADAHTAKEAFSWTTPSAAVSALARGLAATRRAREKIADPDVAFLLDVKARQFGDALAAAAGLQVTAIAQPAGLSDPTGPFATFAAPPTLDAVTPGETVDVRVTIAGRAGAPLRIGGGELAGPAGTRLPLDIGTGLTPASPVTVRASLTVPADAPVTRPYFARSSIGETRYTMVDAGSPMPFAPPAFVVSVDYDVEGTTARATVPVMRREAQLPYGYALRELEILPPVALSVSPGVLIVPTDGRAHTRDVQVDVVSYSGAGASGEVRLEAPAGWTVTPATRSLTLTTAGSRARLTFRVTTTPMAHGIQRLRALAINGGRTFSTDYQVVRHRDLPLRYLVREASALVSAFDVRTTPGLRVGYVMGVGDEMPAAIEQLGAQVTLLDRDALATGDLSRFTTIVTGTRAYAVRDDLREHNRRLLDWVRDGGTMVVLYNTPELVPDRHAPYPGTLPGNAEEVSEQTAPVEILAPADALMTRPNRIGPPDFDGWIEQRGSKFFTTWDPRYTALVSSHDTDQPAQRGGWLTTRDGKGRWTYMAYALHRQVPYGVPGAYRILANLITPDAQR
jgi:LmbE family N-acetylglucosaminyl deacetylase